MNNIELIREEMKKNNIDLWIGHSYDAHGSEYICDHDNVIKFATGFTGENATLAVLAEEAYLWVDGRFFIQAPQETAGTGITIMKMEEEGVPKFDEWLEEKRKTLKNAKESGESIADLKITISEDPELIAPVWTGRPARPCNRIWIHEDEYEERRAIEKLALLREQIQEDGIWIKKLDEIAWLTNLRGSDIDYNPVFFSYMFVDKKRAVLYVQPDAVSGEVRNYLAATGIEIKDYADAIKPMDADESDIVGNIKACKSLSEAKHMEECNLRDAAYLTRFIYKIKKRFSSNENKRQITELSAGEYLDSLRAADSRFVGLSFPTIAAYGEHGAIVHYTADEQSNIPLEDKGFLLVDSGAHYLDGTTDVTRTIALGALSDEEKKNYTLVMMGMLRLMHAGFTDSTDSVELNDLARKPLKDFGLDFNHGLGHGIGYLNLVHEGPVSFRKTITGFTFKPGMIVSDEPGVYIEGSHGIRIENMLLCEETAAIENGGSVRMDGEAMEKASKPLAWKNLTWVPLESEAVVKEYMTEKDIEYYNEYQSLVYDKLSPLLEDDERKWLKEVCNMI